MIHHDDAAPGNERTPDPYWLADVEALSLEISAELREIVETLTTYRHTIGNAARLMARTHASRLAGEPEATELARELARMVHIEAEIEALLSPPDR